jgi:uncharacterized RDD family membrane protein YckC
MVKADIGSRILSIIIDSVVVGIVGGIFIGSGNSTLGAIVSFVIGLAYNWYFWTRHNGQTLGKQLMKLRVVKEDGSDITDVDALIRFVGYYLNSIIFGLGWIWALFDDKGQGWHDKIARTMVVKA